MTLSPTSQVIAFKIWQAANPEEWNLTNSDLAKLTGIPVSKIRRICQIKGWSGRLRPEKPKTPPRRPENRLYDDFDGLCSVIFE